MFPLFLQMASNQLLPIFSGVSNPIINLLGLTDKARAISSEKGLHPGHPGGDTSYSALMGGLSELDTVQRHTIQVASLTVSISVDNCFHSATIYWTKSTVSRGQTQGCLYLLRRGPFIFSWSDSSCLFSVCGSRYNLSTLDKNSFLLPLPWSSYQEFIFLGKQLADTMQDAYLGRELPR